MIMGAVAPFIQGDVPPPIIEVFNASEVKTGLVAVIVALLSFIAALVGLAKRWIDKRFNPIEEGVKAVRYQAENEHGPDGKDDNLREQMDRIEGITVGLRDEMIELRAEHRSTSRRMDRQFGEVHDRDVQTTHRIENLEERAEADHKQLRVEIARKRDK